MSCPPSSRGALCGLGDDAVGQPLGPTRVTVGSGSANFWASAASGSFAARPADLF